YLWKKKKYKTKSFAAGVDRELIEKGAQMLGMTLDEVIEGTLQGMRQIAAQIGLDGSQAE
ncbi:MAG: hydrolase, partial [Eubacteriales bacterium]|nr:hydrolase [Eubacteriales bacterium]